MNKTQIKTFNSIKRVIGACNAVNNVEFRLEVNVNKQISKIFYLNFVI